MTAHEAWSRLAVLMHRKHDEPFAELFPFEHADLREYADGSYCFHYTDATFYALSLGVVEYRHPDPPIDPTKLIERAWTWEGKRMTMPSLPWEPEGLN